MTTLTIQIPDGESSVIATIADLVKNAGGEINIDIDDENLSQQEFDALQEGLKEAILIKKGIVKGIPASQLWND
ncbi:hypothetical protein [Mucilaginibacter celer]|uniref:Uncharacterized protein n=1 Tax=Mucilaginibacter celer TaxID=2305508 RepID=A0A494VQ80_9SPHI|nr:hypothetical protein [Mucilaginibacter celer]AYL97686.1 hypothetical protein HYN43_021380 [Mucilaginibacter celer]